MTDIYHNPRCTKSRQTLALLKKNDIQTNIIDYMSQPPDVDTLRVLIKQLGLSPRSLLRKNEAIYKELGLKNQDLTDTLILQAMSQYPKLIERPIVVHSDNAKIGRPPVAVLELFAL
jgi:arsenate reductase|tara:strand:- start:1411 stop:1761 length:351 start_codon:yes stop_codon:yes gene_type:complete